MRIRKTPPASSGPEKPSRFLVMGAAANASRLAVLQASDSDEETEVQAPTGGERHRRSGRHGGERAGRGLNTLVTNYLAPHQGTGFFGRPCAYLSGWRQRLLDSQPLLGAFNGLHL